MLPNDIAPWLTEDRFTEFYDEIEKKVEHHFLGTKEDEKRPELFFLTANKNDATPEKLKKHFALIATDNMQQGLYGLGKQLATEYKEEFPVVAVLQAEAWIKIANDPSRKEIIVLCATTPGNIYKRLKIYNIERYKDVIVRLTPNVEEPNDYDNNVLDMFFQGYFIECAKQLGIIKKES